MALERETVIERSIKQVRQMRGGRQQVALRAGVDLSGIDKLIDSRDERVIDAILSMTGNGGRVRAVDTSVKVFIEKILRSAAWDKRCYGVYGRTGVGKTFAVMSVIETIQEPTAYVRVNETNKNAKARLIYDIYRALHVKIKKSEPSQFANGHNWFNRLVDLLERERALIIVDEAQRLSEAAFESLRDIYDMTPTSLVMIGSIVFEGKIGVSKISDEVFGQSLRRMDLRYELPHATPGDVKVFLQAFGIEIEKPEARLIAKRIGEYGDIDTLARAMRIISGSVEEGELSWRKVGAGQIVDAIERVRTVVKVKDTNSEAQDDTTAKS